MQFCRFKVMLYMKRVWVNHLRSVICMDRVWINHYIFLMKIHVGVTEPWSITLDLVHT